MCRIATFGLFLAGIALSFWPAPTLAGPTVPYKDHVSGSATSLLVSPSPPTVATHIEREGVATYLGRCAIEGDHLLVFTSPTEGFVVGGTVTYTAADGLTMSGTYSGPFETVDGVRLLHLEVVVDEGTRRLDGLTGWAETTVYVVPDPEDPLTAVWDYDATGEVTLP
jgi:hypothetical protein